MFDTGLDGDLIDFSVLKLNYSGLTLVRVRAESGLLKGWILFLFPWGACWQWLCESRLHAVTCLHKKPRLCHLPADISKISSATKEHLLTPSPLLKRYDPLIPIAHNPAPQNVLANMGPVLVSGASSGKGILFWCLYSFRTVEHPYGGSPAAVRCMMCGHEAKCLSHWTVCLLSTGAHLIAFRSPIWCMLQVC